MRARVELFVGNHAENDVMRSINRSALAVFHVCAAAGIGAGAAAAWLVSRWVGSWGVGPSVALGWFVCIGLARIVSQPHKIVDGPIAPATLRQFRWDLHLLTLLFLLNPVIKSRLLPVPILTLVYRFAGARWGRQVYCNGVILDPPHVEIGSQVMLGEACIVYAHVIELDRLEIHRVRIGDGATVGAGAIILPGAAIGANAIVAAGSVVAKHTQIGAGEVWAGVPAKRLRSARPDFGMMDPSEEVAQAA